MDGPERTALPAAEHRQAYATEGYLLLRGLLPLPEVAAARAVAETIGRLGRIVSFPDSTGRDSQLAFGVQAAQARDLHELVSSPPLAATARALLGADIVHLDSRLSLKVPASGAWEWHQEYRYWQSRGLPEPDTVSAMVYLDAATRLNGCLQVIPKSHVGGLLPHVSRAGQYCVPQEVVTAALKQSSPVFAEAEAGSVLFFHGNLLHASAANESNSPRLAVLITYAAASNGALGEPLL